MPTNRAWLDRLLQAGSTAAIEQMAGELPIVPENQYEWSKSDPRKGWRDGMLHWVPVGRDRGNAGRVQLAGEPFNPIAERLVNGMEAIIEQARQAELKAKPNAEPPGSPREAVERYFGIPRLDHIPLISDKDKKKKLDETLIALRHRLTLKLELDKKAREFTIEVRDRGIGQTPARMHETLLSLGQTDKADKPYMIGVFGQGGSSTYAASEVSVVISRRAPELMKGGEDGIGWTFVKRIHPLSRRDPYFAYLAVNPEGRVPELPASAAPGDLYPNGVLFRHIDYDFGGASSSVARALYPAMNHVLFNPVLPYNLYALKESADAMYGNAQRLTGRTTKLQKGGARGYLDKSFQPQSVGGAA